MRPFRRRIDPQAGAPPESPEDRSWSNRTAERSIGTSLAMVTGVTLALVPLQTLAIHAQHPHPYLLVLVAAALATTTWRGLRIARAAVPPAPARIDVAVCLAMLGPAVAIELWAQPASVTQGQCSSSTAALTATAYFAARVPRPWSWLIPVVAAVVHTVAIRSYPGAATQGGPMILGACVASLLVARELRRAGSDADAAAAAAAAAERVEGCARVHDAQGLLRVATRWGDDGDRIIEAVHRTEQGVTDWLVGDLAGSSESTVARIERVVSEFPDLVVDTRIDPWRSTPAPLDADVAAAVTRAVHTLLTNVREHCSDAPVHLEARLSPTGWELVVEDHGAGFHADRVRWGRGLGRYCFEHLTALDVRVDIDSRPDHGTRVHLSGRRATRPAVSRPAHRFAAWRARPVHGTARMTWIADVARTAVLVMLWALEVSGLPTTVHEPHGVVAAVAALSATLFLTIHWALAADPGLRSTVAVGTAAVLLGSLATGVAGPAALDNGKLGMVTAAWGCFYVATVASVPRSWLVGMALLHLPAAVPNRPAEGLLAGAFMVGGPLVAATIVRALRDLAATWDHELTRRAQAERRAAAAILHRQLRAVGRAGATVDHVLEDSAAWLDQAEGPAPGRRPATIEAIRRGVDRAAEGRATIDLTGMQRGPTPAQARALEIAFTGLLPETRRPPSHLDVRGTGDDLGWRLAVLVEHAGDAARMLDDAGLAALEAAGIRLSQSDVGPGAGRLVLRGKVDR